ncbi:hypothetical protein EVAR_82972_1 [Eumeta japonica]|uniref:Uncharacterized protein n=1 Tax=Eumeta variegata TaxID=151549 RepID=A0A4C1VRJ2_EUMVA|nr:hypothetical protein EVAR_82972_1 [Eumeta japonica]
MFGKKITKYHKEREGVSNDRLELVQTRSGAGARCRGGRDPGIKCEHGAYALMGRAGAPPLARPSCKHP